MPAALAKVGRTEAICAAIIEEVRRHRHAIEDAPAVASIVIEVFLQDGPAPIRSIRYGEHRHVARRSHKD